MADNLKLLVKNKNTATIVGSFTVEHVNSIISAGNEFIFQADHPNFDLSEIAVCDSSSVAMLIKWCSLAKNQNKQIKFSSMPNQMLAIMKVSGIDSLLESSI